MRPYDDEAAASHDDDDDPDDDLLATAYDDEFDYLIDLAVKHYNEHKLHYLFYE